MAFFVFVKMGKVPLSREAAFMRTKFHSLLYKTKLIDSMLPCICPVIDHRGRQNVVRTSVTHSAIASCATFSSVIYYWTDARQHGIYLLNGCTREVAKHGSSVRVIHVSIVHAMAFTICFIT